MLDALTAQLPVVYVYLTPFKHYYNKGKELYTNFFDKDDHLEIYELISNIIAR